MPLKGGAAIVLNAIFNTRKKVTFHDARQVADMCMIVISHAHIVQDKI